MPGSATSTSGGTLGEARGRRPMPQLTIDVRGARAEPLALRQWVSGVLEDPGASNAARANALRITARMRIPARTDLRGAALQGEDLSYRELGKVDFTGADLTGARLVGANLSGAVLAAAPLARARPDRARP